MITPWDSLGMGSKLHVATDLEATILSLSLLGILLGGLTALIKSQVGQIHIPDTLISLMTCFMGMITPWDSLGMGSTLHVDYDLVFTLSHTNILFFRYGSGDDSSDQKSSW